MLRNRFTGLCLIILSLMISSTAMSLPKETSAVFDVFRNDTSVGYLETSLKYLGQTYEYSKFTQSTGLAKLLTKARITEKAIGKHAGERLIPVSYAFDQKTRKKHVTDNARFAGNRASGMYKGNAYSVRIPANVLDRASLEIAVARDLARNLPRLQYSVMDRGKIKQYIFARVGSERLSTNAGVFNTIKLEVKREDKSRKTTYWMAKELAYLPVKMIHEEGGDTISSVIRQFSIKP